METGLFQRTRTIRFKLESIKTDIINQKINALESANIDELNKYCINLVVNGQILYGELKKILFKDDELKILRKDVAIKYTWSRLFTKTEFYDFRKSIVDNENKKQFSIKEIPFLKNKLLDWFKEWENIIETLNIYIYESEEGEHNLQNDFAAQIFEITSLDLRRSEPKNLKEHTLLWLDFWEKNNDIANYPIRINPQLTIFWRNSKTSRVEKYGEQSERFDVKMKNRYLYPQFTLATTFTENATTQSMNFAFKDAESKAKQIKKFNSQLTINSEYSFGIDTGNAELATLALAKKSNEIILPNLFTVYTLKDLNFSKTGYFKDGTPRPEPYLAVKNLSYFTNKEQYDKTFKDEKYHETFDELFEKKSVSAIDLTTAKVMNDLIITNGDIISLINLKILHAKRKIYQVLIDDPNFLLTNDNLDEYFQIRREYDLVKPYQEIEQELYKYFRNNRKNIVQLEDNINKVRKSVVANMIGVITLLFKSYPGIITMEDLPQNTIEADRKQFEGNLARPLEIALYNKFAKENLIPPIFNEIIQIRENKKNKITQVGIARFVSEAATSTTCPNCNKQAYKSNDEKYVGNKQSKMKGHKQVGIFECIDVKCGLFIKRKNLDGLLEAEKIRVTNNPDNSKGYDSLDSNDKIAAFNIAKRGLANTKYP